jgi:hypothetical protein
MEWMVRGWRSGDTVAFCVAVAAGVALVVSGLGGFAVVAAVALACGVRWAQWQIPPPGRSRAAGSPDDAGRQLGRVATAVLIVVLAAEVVAVLV